jgi:hypothetical protein
MTEVCDPGPERDNNDTETLTISQAPRPLSTNPLPPNIHL